MQKKGSQLEFISWINRNGHGTAPLPENMLQGVQDDTFELSRLSLSDDTFIAHGFNSYVVRLKAEQLIKRVRPCLCISCPKCGAIFYATALNKEYHNDNDCNRETLNDIADYAKKGYSVSFKSASEFSLSKCECK